MLLVPELQVNQCELIPYFDARGILRERALKKKTGPLPLGVVRVLVGGWIGGLPGCVFGRLQALAVVLFECCFFTGGRDEERRGEKEEQRPRSPFEPVRTAHHWGI